MIFFKGSFSFLDFDKMPFFDVLAWRDVHNRIVREDNAAQKAAEK